MWRVRKEEKKSEREREFGRDARRRVEAHPWTRSRRARRPRRATRTFGARWRAAWSCGGSFPRPWGPRSRPNAQGFPALERRETSSPRASARSCSRSRDSRRPPGGVFAWLAPSARCRSPPHCASVHNRLRLVSLSPNAMRTRKIMGHRKTTPKINKNHFFSRRFGSKKSSSSAPAHFISMS